MKVLTLSPCIRGEGWLCCHGNPILQLSRAHQFPQQHHKAETVDNYFRHNTIERVAQTPYQVEFCRRSSSETKLTSKRVSERGIFLLIRPNQAHMRVRLIQIKRIISEHIYICNKSKKWSDCKRAIIRGKTFFPVL